MSTGLFALREGKPGVGCWAARTILAAVVLAGTAATSFGQGVAGTQIRGTAVVAVADHLQNHGSETEYYIRDEKTGNPQALHFVDGAPASFRTGATVTVNGDLQGQQVLVRNADVTVEKGAPVQPLEATAQAATGQDATGQTVNATTGNAPATFTQKVIVILLNFLDQTNGCSIAECNDHVFGPTNSVQSLYAETSYGHVTYTGKTVGPFTINVRTTASCPSPYLPTFEQWAGLADKQAESAGIDLSGYNEKVYILPQSDPCGKERGYATIGGSPSMAWIGVWSDPEVVTHEMGHNLGMAHARTLTDEYGDHSDIMGNTTVGIRDLDAPHRDQFNWIPAANIAKVTDSGQYTIVPLEVNPSQSASPQVLKIFKADTSEYYYFSYRQPGGYDTILPNFYSGLYTDGVSVHRFAGPDANDTHTFFLQGLRDGNSFSDKANNITVTQVSHDGAGVKVNVNMGGAAANLSSTSLSFAKQQVNTSSAAQDVRLTNIGVSTLGISSVAIAGVNSGDFQLSSKTCASSLAAGSSCLFSITFTPTAGGARSAFLSITDGLGTQQVSLSGSGAGPDFSLSAQGSTTQTVSAGAPATFGFSVAGTDGFSGNVAVSCSVAAAAGATCTAKPSTVAVGGSTTISVATTAHQLVLPTNVDRRSGPWQRFVPVLMYVGIAGMMMFIIGRMRRLRIAMAIPAASLLVLLTMQTSGCAGGVSVKSNSSGTPSAVFGTQAGSYTVTITGTSSMVTHNVTTTLVVR